MRVRKHLPVRAPANPPPRLELVDPRRVPQQLRYDADSGRWVADPRKACPECGHFFVSATLASGRTSKDPTCSAKCGHRRSRRRVKARRVQTLDAALRRVDRGLAVFTELREDLSRLLRDVGRE